MKFLLTLSLTWLSCTFAAAQDSLTDHCGYSLLFNDTAKAVLLPVSSHYYSGTYGGYTWECWFKLDRPLAGGTPTRPLIDAIDNVTFEDQYLGFGWDGGWYDEPVTNLVFKVDGPGAAPSHRNCRYAPPGGFQLNTGYMATGVADYEDHIQKLFLDGVAVDSVALNVPPITRTINTELSCDCNWDHSFPRPLYGRMDEVRIWERALSNAEVMAQYNHCLSGSEANLFLYYRCNDASGLNVSDATALANDGTFSPGGRWAQDEPLLAGNDCPNFCTVEEICGNGIDDDHDGLTDEGCPCDITLSAPLYPNVFSPNNDAKNDVFRFDAGVVETLQCSIYDRWGLLIATLSSPSDSWDGKTKNGGECPQGTYYFIVNGTMKCSGKAFQNKGFIQLLR